MSENLKKAQEVYYELIQFLTIEGVISPDRKDADLKGYEELRDKLFGEAPPDNELANKLLRLPRQDLMRITSWLERELVRIKGERAQDELIEVQERKRQECAQKLLEETLPDAYKYVKIGYAASYLANQCIGTFLPEDENNVPENFIKLLNDEIYLEEEVDSKPNEPIEKWFLRRLAQAIKEFNAKKELKPARRALDAEYPVRDQERIDIEKDWEMLANELVKEFQIEKEFTISDLVLIREKLRNRFDINSVALKQLPLNEIDLEKNLDQIQQKLISLFKNKRTITNKEIIEIIEQHFHIYKFNIGNPGFFGQYPSPEMIQAVAERLEKDSGYGDQMGEKHYREKIAEFYDIYLKNKGAKMPPIDKDNIIIGAGASEIIEFFILAGLEGGDQAVGTSPIYPLYPSLMKMIGRRLNASPLKCDNDKNEWIFDLEDFEMRINVHTKYIFLNSPNNPTGAIFDKETIRRIFEIAKEYNLFIISDEIYAGDIYEEEDNEKFCSVGELAYEMGVPALIVNGLSKGYGKAAGWRIGWGVLIDKDEKIKDILKITSSSLAADRLCPNVPCEAGIAVIMDDLIKFEERKAQAIANGKNIKDIDISDLTTLQHLNKLKEITKNQREAAMEGFNEGPLSLVLPQGAYYGFFKIDGIDSQEEEKEFARQLLIKKRVHIVPGGGFEYPEAGYFRMVFLAHEDVILEGARIIREFAKEWTSPEKDDGKKEPDPDDGPPNREPSSAALAVA